jgi:hypothetical protein
MYRYYYTSGGQHELRLACGPETPVGKPRSSALRQQLEICDQLEWAGTNILPFGSPGFGLAIAALTDRSHYKLSKVLTERAGELVDAGFLLGPPCAELNADVVIEALASFDVLRLVHDASMWSTDTGCYPPNLYVINSTTRLKRALDNIIEPELSPSQKEFITDYLSQRAAMAPVLRALRSLRAQKAEASRRGDKLREHHLQREYETLESEWSGEERPPPVPVDRGPAAQEGHAPLAMLADLRAKAEAARKAGNLYLANDLQKSIETLRGEPETPQRGSARDLMDLGYLG